MDNKDKDMNIEKSENDLEKIKQNCMDGAKTIVLSTDKGIFYTGTRVEILKMTCNVIARLKNEYPGDLMAQEIYKVLGKSLPSTESRSEEELLSLKKLSKNRS